MCFLYVGNFLFWGAGVVNVYRAVEEAVEMFLEAVGLERWPHNALRHSFATYDLSAHRNQTRTSLMLKHRSPGRLWSNYLASLVPPEVGLRYFAIGPELVG